MNTARTHTQRAKITLLLLGAMCLGGALMGVGSSFADNLRSTQTVVGSELVVPYDGYLMIDSQPITGAREIRFELFESASGGAAEWTETQTVALYNGRFSVGLGTSTVLTDTLLDAEKLWLAMTIIDTNAAGTPVEIPLSGRQAIEPAPFAAWAANSADMRVAGNLDVAGAANVGALDVTGAASVGGPLDVDSGARIDGGDNDGSSAALRVGRTGSPQFGYVLIDNNEIDNTNGDFVINGNSNNPVRFGTGAVTVAGNLSTQGDVSLGNGTNDDTTISGSLTTGEDFVAGGAYLPRYRNWDTTTGDGGAGIFNDSGNFKALMIVGNDSAGAGTGAPGDRAINLYDDVTVTGDLTVAGDITNLGYSRFTASDNGPAAAQTVTLTPTSRSVCFMGRMFNRGLSQPSDESECSVGLNGSSWELNASSTGAQVQCTATCLTW